MRPGYNRGEPLLPPAAGFLRRDTPGLVVHVVLVNRLIFIEVSKLDLGHCNFVLEHQLLEHRRKSLSLSLTPNLFRRLGVRLNLGQLVQ